MLNVKETYEQFKTENPELEAFCGTEVMKAYELCAEAYEKGCKLMTCGNGGSAADAEHIVGELMKGFVLQRPLPKAEIDTLEELFGAEGKDLGEKLQGSMPAIALTGGLSLTTAFANDVAPENGFAQQLYGYGKAGDVLIALSTSGNSKNVIQAVRVAKLKGVKTVAITGEKESKLSALCDVTIKMPSTKTYRIQEYTLPVYHVLCAMLEARFFNE